MGRGKDICCNICGSCAKHFMFYGIDRLHGFEGRFGYVKCGKCGLVYMNPQIDEEEVLSFYPESYGPHRDGGDSRKDEDIRKKLPRGVFAKINKSSNVLDIGCGKGKFLYNMKKQTGCNVEGVDISANAVEQARAIYGLSIFQGSIFDVPRPGDHFDLITAFSYIEHVPDPGSAVKKISELLKPGGLFLIKTPNTESWAAKVFRDKWYHLDCPRHLFLFSPKTLSALVKSKGLSVEGIEFEKSSKGWSGSLQYCFYENNYQPGTRNKIKRSRLARIFTSPIARIAYMFKKSDIMTIYGYK